MPTRILFRLEIRKYLGLFYIAPSFWKREKETGEGSFKSKIEWKAPSPEGRKEGERREKPLLALHLCEMRNIYARMLLKGGTAEKEGERERAPHTHIFRGFGRMYERDVYSAATQPSRHNSGGGQEQLGRIFLSFPCWSRLVIVAVTS